jgi:hypothetical protein
MIGYGLYFGLSIYFQSIHYAEQKPQGCMRRSYLSSRASLSGNGGKILCGSAWYQETTEAIASCNGKYLPPLLHPNA